MKRPVNALPEDVDSLKRVIAEQQSAIAKNEQTIDSQAAQLDTQHSRLRFQQTRIEQLEQKLHFLQHARFGASSEKHLGQGDLQLFNEAELLDAQRVDEDIESVSVTAHTRQRKRARELPEDLPSVDVVHDLDDADKHCEVCGATMQRIGEECSTLLAVIPLQYFRIRHIRRKYACSCKGCIKTAPMPALPLPGTQASAQLLSHIAVSKYADGLPLYRQEKIAARVGIELPRSKQARWLIQTTSLLQPIYNLFQDTFFSYDICASDETGIQVLKEDGRRAENGSYLWIRRGGPPDKPVVLVDYARSKSADTASGLLSQCRGYLVCDAASSFNQVLKDNALTAVLCNDHARRKFDQALKGLNKTLRTKAWIAKKAINFYKELYRLERTMTKNGDNRKTKYQRRQDKAVPIWEAFIDWATTVHVQGVVDDKTREALAYLLKHEQGLRQYCEDGRLPISNIKSEHIAKTIAIARKNFLYADTPAGAKSSAMLFSMIESAKANSHNPHHYLSVLLSDLPNAKSVDDIEALLPWRLTPTSQASAFMICRHPRQALSISTGN